MSPWSPVGRLRDEIGDLPAMAQVKLLRALQAKEIVRLGSTRATPVDVRVVAATHRTLTQEIAAGRFREDLFYRLAVAVLKLPALRERKGDVGLLIDHLLAHINRESRGEPGFSEKKLSAGARNLLLNHPWPGNVRELLNTLQRAVIWCEGPNISAEDLREVLFPVPAARSEIMNRPLGDAFSLPDVLAHVAEHYLARALEEAQGNKTEAAKLVGLASYQTFSNWQKKYGVKAARGR